MTGPFSKAEILTDPQRRRRWSVSEKLEIVAETREPGVTVSLVARRRGVSPNQLLTWLRLAEQGALTATRAGGGGRAGVRVAGEPGADPRVDLMVAAVEQRFGPINRQPATIEWLTDNGSCYIAGETRKFAREIGFEPLTTPVESPQSNGMAEATSPASRAGLSFDA